MSCSHKRGIVLQFNLFDELQFGLTWTNKNKELQADQRWAMKQNINKSKPNVIHEI